MKLVARIAHLFKKPISHHVHDVYDEWSWHFYDIHLCSRINIITHDNVYLFKTMCNKNVDTFLLTFVCASSPCRILEYMYVNHRDIVLKCKSTLDNFKKYGQCVSIETFEIYNKYFPEP